MTNTKKEIEKEYEEVDAYPKTLKDIENKIKKSKKRYEKFMNGFGSGSTARMDTMTFYFHKEKAKLEILEELKAEAIKIFKNLQGPETIYPLILNKFPENCKGSLAKDKWNSTEFRYGTEYGMLAMLYWLINLKEEDLK